MNAGPVRPGRPPRADAAGRALRQRDRILDAAENCFIRDGFHAASMASIADAAGMSAGLIYRYFESKQAIVLAIIARQLAQQEQRLAALRSGGHLAQRATELWRDWSQRADTPMSAPLFLEMSALATRDDGIARAIADADRIGGARFHDWLRRQPGLAALDPPALEARALLLQCFIEGLAIRAVRAPDTDPAVVAEAARLATSMLDAGMPPAGGDAG